MAVPRYPLARRAAVSAAAFTALAVLIGQDERSTLRAADRAVTRLTARGRPLRAVGAARALSGLAEPEPVRAALAVAAMAAAGRGDMAGAVLAPMAVLTGARARRALSRAIARQRPPEEHWLAEPEGFSLPSKHTTLAALTAGTCAAALGADSRRQQAAAAVAAAGIGASRIYLGVHWPSDVLAGWLFAAGWLAVADTGHEMLSRRCR